MWFWPKLKKYHSISILIIAVKYSMNGQRVIVHGRESWKVRAKKRDQDKNLVPL